jgi:hypothetical protein
MQSESFVEVKERKSWNVDGCRSRKMQGMYTGDSEGGSKRVEPRLGVGSAASGGCAKVQTAKEVRTVALAALRRMPTLPGGHASLAGVLLRIGSFAVRPPRIVGARRFVSKC